MGRTIRPSRKPPREMACTGAQPLLPHVDHVFAERVLLIFLKRPGGLEMIVVDELVDRVMHMPVVRALQIRGVLEIKRPRLGLRRVRSAHRRLIAGHAVMRQFDLAAIEVIHGDHLHRLALLHHAEFSSSVVPPAVNSMSNVDLYSLPFCSSQCPTSVFNWANASALPPAAATWREPASPATSAAAIRILAAFFIASLLSKKVSVTSVTDLD